MTYIENIYVCLAAPLLVAALCLRSRRRTSLLFLLAGMTACLLSSYISTFLAAAHGVDALVASLEIAPAVEEGMKLLPTLFYLLVFEPDRKDASNEALMTAVGFATLENVCYLTGSGAARTLYLLVRGFGTGAMHVVCAAMVAAGLKYFWDRLSLRLAGTLGLLGLAVTYHAIYNLLVSQTGAAMLLGCLLPVLTAALAAALGGVRHFRNE